MACQSLRTFSLSRVLSRRHFITSRAYVAPARAWTLRPPAVAKPKLPSQVAQASTKVERTGNPSPKVTETLPSTSAETDPAPEATPSLLSFPSEESFTGDKPGTDWSKSYHGLSTQAFSKDIAELLLAPIDPLDIEMKPGKHYSKCSLFFVETQLDGLIYLPEIKYRRVLNKAFGPGAWGLAPRSETNVGPKIVSREYALVCQGRSVRLVLTPFDLVT